MQHNHPISFSKDRQEQDWEQPEATFRARLVFISPAHSAYKGQTILEVVQHSWLNGRSVLLPSLSFHRMIPETSEIFDAIGADSVDKVSRLLRERKFLATDTTMEGCSLLGFALGSLSVQVVKFLIDHGAEVDAVEPDWQQKPDRIARPKLSNRYMLQPCVSCPRGNVVFAALITVFH
ncbi:hypothetical protein LTS07_010236 [Exophiala sideris]|nr:hypothetical protein LTS07_010236 [Exophiala sideris]